MQFRLLVTLLLILCMGCGSSGPFDYLPVEGVVTYEDGTPIPVGGIELKFIAQNVSGPEGAKPRPAIAHLDDQGKFALVTSYKYGDGLIPGKHKVAITKAFDKNKNPLVPEEYLSTKTTPLIIDTSNLPLEIKVPKP